MTRELIILRHAKSSWAQSGQPDRERPLNARGQHDAPRIGAWLATQGLHPDQVLVSTAQRTRETAALVLEPLGFPMREVRWEDRVYEARLATLLDLLARIPGTSRRTLLIGHNPGLEDLADHLSAQPLAMTDGKLLPTCTAIVFALPDDWARLPAGSGRVLHYQRPRELE